MEIQRLRNLTTGKLHTKMEHIYQDFEFITGMDGIMTHMLPNLLEAVKPWLVEKVTGTRFWDNTYDISHLGVIELSPMTEQERQECLYRYKALPHPFTKLGENHAR